ncbi:Diaminohydroxyphosphoribosylaminopyrimidine deaminase / 5-amino-6-(5-phosphoribosylamino)uracil reductase [hydrothermal vent metagenome]|uniref:5-amino-6-(5-phosphoribosylamino)uracil reductase n=1 Tax=hydrothermal vent metagenome TaxID=652676 RepID=A0A3B1E440_9ZZZZ
MDSSYYINLAISKAWKYQFIAFPNPAVGACVVRNGKLLSIGVHYEAGQPHAEINALKKAYTDAFPYSILTRLKSSQDIHRFLSKYHNNFFHNCSIYVTLEPCNHIGKTPSCAMLLEKIGIKGVIIGTLDPNKLASGGTKRLKKSNIYTKVLNSKNSYNLLLPFTKWTKKNFSLFKLAIREDGTTTNGYITSQDSLNLVHKIRTKLDLLVIGGETVRTDRPTLDSRFSNSKKNPDILIYSQQKEFDTTIPLFNVPNRKIIISDNLNRLDHNNFIMIEGGLNLLKHLNKHFDMLMLFISHKHTVHTPFDYRSLKLKKIHSYFINKYDEIYFLIKF